MCLKDGCKREKEKYQEQELCNVKKRRRHLKFRWYVFGILMAIEMIMSFTFLGYIHIPPISVTTAFIPIVVAGCLLGPLESTIMGLAFGLGSMYKASAFYVTSNDRVFSPFRSGAPFESMILSVGTRVLFGLIIGILFMLIKNRKYVYIWNGVLAAFASQIHAILVYGAMGIFFPELGFNCISAFHLEDRGSLLIALICVICVEILYKVYNADSVRKYAAAVDKTESSLYFSGKILVGFCMITLFIVCMAFFPPYIFQIVQSICLVSMG